MNTRSLQFLIQSIASTQGQTQYAWFLGAGCSVSSGVRTASAMISEWRGRLFFIENSTQFQTDRPLNDYLQLCIACSVDGDELRRKIALNNGLRLAIFPAHSAARFASDVTNDGGAHLIKGRTLLKGTRKPIHMEWTLDPSYDGAVVFPFEVIASTYQSFSEWLEKQPWFGQTFEYSVLFEKLFDRPSLRQAYIETEVEHAKPYWGYLYLADMMSRGFFNVCFTTNFDDLLNDAFLRFTTGQKPIVCAHDSLVSQIRLTSKRSKIVKLHGDFLYDSIKNTQSELRDLDRNMAEKFRQFASEVGLIVVGYSGSDNSIMNILLHLLRGQESFPHGIHWCIRPETRLTDKVDELAKDERVSFYETHDFDSLMAELYEGLGFGVPAFAANPTGTLETYVDNCYSVLRDPPHPIVLKHSRQMLETFLGRPIDKLLE